MSAAWPTAEAHAPSLAGLVELARRARRVLAREDEAVAIRTACEAARVRVASRALTVGRNRHTAMLVPTEAGFTALVDCELWDRAASAEAARKHLRFVLAHELAHTFFYRPGTPPSRTSAPDDAEERFCNGFATFLLVPSDAASRAPLDPGGLHALAGRFDVSRRVAAWAIIRARPGISILEFRRGEHPQGGREAMRLQWGASPHFLARGESLKSPLADLAPGEHGSCSQRLRLGGRDHDVDLEAWRHASSLFVFASHRQTRASAASTCLSPACQSPAGRALTLFP